MVQLSIATTTRSPILDPHAIGALKHLLKNWSREMVSHGPVRLNVAARAIKKYRYTFGHYPNVIFAKTFNEKLQARKIFDRREIFCIWADKLEARKHVEDKLGKTLLPKLYYQTTDAADIPFDTLPQRYVVKASHGSGWVRIVKDGSTIDRAELQETCREWLATNYYDINHEPIYKNVVPRILIEEFLDNGSGEVPNDYKFYVFGGRVRYIQIDIARFGSHRRNIYDADWNLVPVQLTVQTYDGFVERPAQLSEMLRLAETLSGDIDFVRVDLYEADGKLYFGEMTPSSGNGFNKFTPESYDAEFGSFWQRPESKASRAFKKRPKQTAKRLGAEIYPL